MKGDTGAPSLSAEETGDTGAAADLSADATGDAGAAAGFSAKATGDIGAPADLSADLSTIAIGDWGAEVEAMGDEGAKAEAGGGTATGFGADARGTATGPSGAGVCLFSTTGADPASTCDAGVISDQSIPPEASSAGTPG